MNKKINTHGALMGFIIGIISLGIIIVTAILSDFDDATRIFPNINTLLFIYPLITTGCGILQYRWHVFKKN